MGSDLIALVMAGGAGERLRPLTDQRAKPAVLFGGIYRIIDFTLSNCINSGIRRVFVLTQYKSHSLSNHLKATYGFLSRRVGEFIDEIPAQMQLGSSWYKGTADAVRQNLSFVETQSPEQVLVLSGDHIYKMDYSALRDFHAERRAILSLAVTRVDVDQARGTYGVVQVNEEGRVVGFVEKPQDPPTIPGTRDCLISMGIYLFNYEALRECLRSDSGDDFGSVIIPSLIAANRPVFAFDFSRLNNIEELESVAKDGHRVKRLVARASDSDYWRDVGGLESFWLGNLDLVAPTPRFNLYGEKWPLFCFPQHFPPAKFVHESPGRVGEAVNSIVCDGVIVSGGKVRSSILSPGIYVHSYALIENSVLFGGSIQPGFIHETSIGRGCRIRNAIIDKTVSLREGTVIGYNRAEDEARGLKTQSLSGSSDYLVVVPRRFHT